MELHLTEQQRDRIILGLLIDICLKLGLAKKVIEHLKAQGIDLEKLVKGGGKLNGDQVTQQARV